MDTIKQNANQTLVKTVKGDYRNNLIFFTLKKSTKDSNRVIDLLVTDVSYDGAKEETTFNIPLLPEVNQELTGQKVYYYDLRVENSATDRRVLNNGVLKVEHTVRRDSDILPPKVENAIVISASDLEIDDMLVVKEENGDKLFVAKNIDELKEPFGILDITSRIDQVEADATSNNNNLSNRIDQLTTRVDQLELTINNEIAELTSRIEYLEMTKASTEEIILITT